jgi:hypothetical protein
MYFLTGSITEKPHTEAQSKEGTTKHTKDTKNLGLGDRGRHCSSLVFFVNFVVRIFFSLRLCALCVRNPWQGLARRRVAQFVAQLIGNRPESSRLLATPLS